MEFGVWSYFNETGVEPVKLSRTKYGMKFAQTSNATHTPNSTLHTKHFELNKKQAFDKIKGNKKCI